MKTPKTIRDVVVGPQNAKKILATANMQNEKMDKEKEE